MCLKSNYVAKDICESEDNSIPNMQSEAKKEDYKWEECRVMSSCTLAKSSQEKHGPQKGILRAQSILKEMMNGCFPCPVTSIHSAEDNCILDFLYLCYFFCFLLLQDHGWLLLIVVYLGSDFNYKRNKNKNKWGPFKDLQKFGTWNFTLSN